MNIDPQGISIKDWCDSMVHELDSFGPIPVLQGEEDWQQWAIDLYRYPGIAARNPPDPRGFDDFYTWARQFNLAVIL